ncbi:GPI transamidase subunit PIG-U [Tribonema minus]|uniref:GPI transamidase subunit PIG-U n=1 Tax=Tribonema minus TaxID=303371 RepID=A0A836CN19_9STRA|nr:GPI transamidase subunit PIG-U [Tribonema minus]
MRALLLHSGLVPMLSSALELVVPHVSWERALEGVFLKARGVSPYTGGAFTGSPALLLLAQLARRRPQRTWSALTSALFIAFDVAAALLIYAVARAVRADEPSPRERQLQAQMPEDHRPRAARARLLAPDLVAHTAAAAYMLNPVLAAQCAARSGEVPARAALLLAVALAHGGAAAAAAAALGASAVVFNLYDATLLLPLALLAAHARASRAAAPLTPPALQQKQQQQQQRTFAHGPPLLPSLAAATPAFLLAAATAAVAASWVTAVDSSSSGGGWRFLRAAADAQLWQRDATPGVGLRWYLTQQAFASVRGYFAVLLAGHALVHAAPLALRLGALPRPLAEASLAAAALFGAPPTLGAPCLVACLMLPHACTLARVRGGAALVVLGGAPLALLPVVARAWLRAGTGNANYLYFQALAANAAAAVGVLQFVAATVRRRKALVMAERAEAAAHAAAQGAGEFNSEHLKRDSGGGAALQQAVTASGRIAEG